MTLPSENPADLDRTDPEGEIAARAEAFRNWGRWGEDDRLGTLNFIDDAARAAAAALVRDGHVVSLSQPFNTDGPQKGWRRRINPVHTMTDTGTDAERGTQGFPHGIGGADDYITMPLQCSTQWDGLGHIFDHGRAWNGRAAGDVVTSDGDLVTGIEHAAAVIVGRGVLLDVASHLADGELGVHNVEREARTAENLAWIAEEIAAGRLVMPVAATYPLDEVAAAFAAMEGPHAPGKIIVTV